MRGLSKRFMCVLKTGFLQPVLELVKLDSTLCLEIRQKYVNIYYRGGNILKIEEKRDSFGARFDTKYFNHSTKFPKELPALLAGPADVKKRIDALPILKHSMDLWFGENFREEREFQQLMVRENNFGNSAKSTDYFICDIEYAYRRKLRCDLIAVHWPSSTKERKNNKNLGLAFIEMKYLDKALTGKAGLEKHIKNANDFLGNQENLEDIKDEMKVVFNQKLELELINNEKPIGSFADNKPEYILVLVNHDPASRILQRELKRILKAQHKSPPTYPHMELKCAVSNFMGYGLYDESIYLLDDFLDRFGDQI